MTCVLDPIQSRFTPRAVVSGCRWKVGIDIGSSATAYQEHYSKDGVDPSFKGLLFPTVVGYPMGREPGQMGNEDAVFIGQDVLSRYDTLKVVHPYRVRGEERRAGLMDFVGRLRRHMGAARKESPWGVVAHPQNIDAERLREFRLIANELFEKILLVEDSALMARGLYHELGTRFGILVDLGASSTRFYLVAGQGTAPGEQLVLAHGGNAIDAFFKASLIRKFPDLALTDLTITRIKETLGFVPPVRRRATLKVHFRGSERALDLTAILQESCETLVEVVLQGLRKIIGRCPSDLVEMFTRSIFFLGGGARMRGLVARVQGELRRDGLDQAVVRTVAAPQFLTASGALQCALSIPDDAWEIPLFSLRG